MDKPTLDRLTAVRTYRGKAATVTTYLDGNPIGKSGGKRAERAAAALVTCWRKESTGELEAPGEAGLRQDLHAAEVEASRMETRTSMTTRPRFGGRGSVLPLRRPEWAIAVPVVEASA